MPMNWNAETDAKLFVAVLATTDTKLNLPAIAEIMGPECTAKALTHRISALKAKAKLAAGSSTVDPTTPAKAAKGPATPRKRGAAAKKAEAEANGNGTASEGDAEESPKKKVKTNGAGAGGRAAAKGKKKAAPSAPPPSPMAPTTPATPGDLEDGGCKLESEGEEEEG